MAGIYIHIPFCKKRCIYCDFFSTTQGNRITEYINALCKELELRKNYLEGETINTIYFGGGTPSQLAYEDFSKVFQTISSAYSVAVDAEITMEANPDDLTSEYVSSISSLPFNRISMGVQTFNDKTLSLLNRRHNSEQAINAYHECREKGFKNISLDLMYGLPGESMERWEKDLSIITELHPEHISAYHLIYEEGTKMWELRKNHSISEINENLSVEMFTVLINRLRTAGYEHYEISNFALPGMYSRHNSSYWRGIKYMGCGASAHSYNIVSRQWNVASLDKYIAGINSGKPDYGMEELDLYTRYNDFIITSLRTSWGMSLKKLKSEYGNELYDYALKMAKEHILNKKLEIEGDTLKLTKAGIFISDGIMSDLLWV